MLPFAEKGDEDSDQLIGFRLKFSETGRRKDAVSFKALEPMKGFISFA